mmetsp:Transcript_28518/g.74900  ORF Transcript_28518/g.74900 Transcript_28518/m.74900 type:complete len:200 (-) Transcript_28518:432-1031(-)
MLTKQSSGRDRKKSCKALRACSMLTPCIDPERSTTKMNSRHSSLNSILGHRVTIPAYVPVTGWRSRRHRGACGLAVTTRITMSRSRHIISVSRVTTRTRGLPKSAEWSAVATLTPIVTDSTETMSDAIAATNSNVNPRGGGAAASPCAGSGSASVAGEYRGATQVGRKNSTAPSCTWTADTYEMRITAIDRGLRLPTST